jgi:signal transduction histidine kinase/ActR/RegA family two-component response regulator
MLRTIKLACKTADIRAAMLPRAKAAENDVIADTLARPRLVMSTRERFAEALLSVGFAAAVIVVWVLDPPGGFAVGPAVASLVVLIIAMRIRIDTPFGFTSPVQLAFVPLLFSMPVAVVPIVVVIGAGAARLPDVFVGDIRPSRLVQSIPNSWYAIGPVAVFAIARVSPTRAGPLMLVGALAAQFAVDFGLSRVREAIARGATLGDLLAQTWIYIVDAALSGVALLVAEQIEHNVLAALAPLPLLGLVAMFARERRQRLESLIELNTAYRLARDEAIEASNMKSAFLRNVSHEIRTPMNGVIGMNELLLQTPLSDEQRSYAEQVEQSGEHMLAIINDILDISKIETGHLELEIAELDLHELIQRACVPPALEARSKGVEFDVRIDPDVPRRVCGDGSRARQVLINLVGNAVKFTVEGSVAVCVRLGSVAENIRIEVVDSGIGLESSRLEQMFEPFVQADVSTTRRFGGNGLGLAIAKELVELMQGTIGASSEPGQGSTFWFEIPLPPATEPAVVAAGRGAPERAGRAGDPGAALVLVVEDSPVNRLVAARVLERGGFRTHVVSDGREALQALSSQSYDAVLMDCQMPDIDGYQATQELRRREEGTGRHTPVIAMTAHAMTGDRERCLQAGMDDYIAKPVRSRALHDALRRWTDPPPSTDDDRVEESLAIAGAGSV